jgi:hypothetical protein
MGDFATKVLRPTRAPFPFFAMEPVKPSRTGTERPSRLAPHAGSPLLAATQNSRYGLAT